MIVISAVFKVQEGKRDRAIDVMQEMANATLKEQGCNDYTFYADLKDPLRFFLFEEWDDQASLDAHFKTEHMAIFRKHLPDLTAHQTQVTRYVVSESGPL